MLLRLSKSKQMSQYLVMRKGEQSAEASDLRTGTVFILLLLEQAGMQTILGIMSSMYSLRLALLLLLLPQSQAVRKDWETKIYSSKKGKQLQAMRMLRAGI